MNVLLALIGGLLCYFPVGICDIIKGSWHWCCAWVLNEKDRINWESVNLMLTPCSYYSTYHTCLPLLQLLQQHRAAWFQLLKQTD